MAKPSWLYITCTPILVLLSIPIIISIVSPTFVEYQKVTQSEYDEDMALFIKGFNDKWKNDSNCGKKFNSLNSVLCYYIEAVTTISIPGFINHPKSIMFIFVFVIALYYTGIYLISHVLYLPWLWIWVYVHDTQHVFCHKIDKHNSTELYGKNMVENSEKISDDEDDGEKKEGTAGPTGCEEPTSYILKIWKNWRVKYGFTTCVNGFHCTAGEKLFEVSHEGIPYAEILKKVTFGIMWTFECILIIAFQKLWKKGEADLFYIYLSKVDDKFLSNEIILGKEFFEKKVDFIDYFILKLFDIVKILFIFVLKNKFLVMTAFVYTWLLSWHMIYNAVLTTAKKLEWAQNSKKSIENASKKQVLIGWNDDELEFLAKVRKSEIPIMKRRLWCGQNRFIGRDNLIQILRRIDFLEKDNEELNFNRKENKKLARKIDRLKQENVSLNNKILNQNKLLNNYRKTADKAKFLVEIEEKYLDLKKEHQSMKAKAYQKLLDLEGRQNDKIKRLEQVNKDYVNSNMAKVELEKVNSELKTKNEQLNRENFSLKSTIETIKTENSKPDPNIELSEKLEEAELELKNKDEEIVSLKEVILNQRNNIEVAQVVSSNVNSVSETEVKRKHKSKGSHKLELRSLQSEIKTLENELKSSRFSYSELENVYLETKMNMAQEINNLRLELNQLHELRN